MVGSKQHKKKVYFKCFVLNLHRIIKENVLRLYKILKKIKLASQKKKFQGHTSKTVEAHNIENILKTNKQNKNNEENASFLIDILVVDLLLHYVPYLAHT